MRTLPAAILMLTVVATAGEARAACPLCQDPPPGRLVRLGARDAFAQAQALARQNRAALARIDALLRQGALGAPGSATARRRAQTMARLSLLNAYSYLFRYAEDPERVYEADAAAMAGVFAEFSEPGMFPLAALRRVRMGLSHVCVRYDLDARARGRTVMGGRTLRYAVEDRLIEGASRRVLAVEWPSHSVGSTEVLLAEHYGFRVSHLRSPGPPGPYELFVAQDVRGAWVRHFGLHRPSAFMFWTSPLDPASGLLPRVPLTGIRIYVPSLKFTLPVLPDIDLDDLRALDLPLPLLELADLRSGRRPAWLTLEDDLALGDWRGVGPLPPQVSALFPNH